jgi:hypothetical protein
LSLRRIPLFGEIIMCRGVTCGLGTFLWVIANMEEMLLTVVSPSLDAYLL